MMPLQGPESIQSQDAIAEFIANIARLNNGAIQQIGQFMATTSPAYRAQVTQRLASLIGEIASSTLPRDF